MGHNHLVPWALPEHSVHLPHPSPVLQVSDHPAKAPAIIHGSVNSCFWPPLDPQQADTQASTHHCLSGKFPVQVKVCGSPAPEGASVFWQATYKLGPIFPLGDTFSLVKLPT